MTAWRAWVELLDRREAPTSLALTRILIAAVVLGDLLQVRAMGLVTAVWAPPPDGIGYNAIWDRNPPFFTRWFGASEGSADLIWWIATAAALLLLVGCATRVAAVVLVLALAQMGHIAPDGDRGIDFLMRAVIAVLAVSPCHARFSVDAWFWRRVGRPLPDEIPAWPRILLFAQLIWVYFSAGHNKSDPAWGPAEGFSALGSVMCDPHFSRFDCSWVAPIYPLMQVATLATMMFELSSPLLPLFTYWDRTRDRGGRLRRLSNRLRLRWAWIAIGVLFHLGIAMTMRLGIFPWGMLALFPVLLHPDELERGARWVRRRLFGRAAAAALAIAGLVGCGGQTQPSNANAHEHEHEHEHEGRGAHGGLHRFEKADDWAKLFDDPSREAWQKPDEVVQHLAATPGMTVVDLGAGTGYFLARLSRAVGSGGKVVATDIEPDMVRYMKERAAREGLPNVEAVLAPADGVGVPDASADRILVVDVWHHLPARAEYAARLLRALRPGGAVLVVDFTLEATRGPPRDHRLAPEVVRAELEAGGFSTELVEETLPDQYIVRAARP